MFSRWRSPLYVRSNSKRTRTLSCSFVQQCINEVAAVSLAGKAHTTAPMTLSNHRRLFTRHLTTSVHLTMWYGAIPLVFELSLILSGLDRLFMPPHTHTHRHTHTPWFNPIEGMLSIGKSNDCSIRRSAEVFSSVAHWCIFRHSPASPWNSKKVRS